MPIYEYVCQSCGEKTEVLQKRNDPAPDCKVDDCSDGTLVRVLSARLLYAAYVAEVVYFPGLRPVYGFVRAWL